MTIFLCAVFSWCFTLKHVNLARSLHPSCPQTSTVRTSNDNNTNNNAGIYTAQILQKKLVPSTLHPAQHTYSYNIQALIDTKIDNWSLTKI